jgi:hypothetical protein
VDEVTEMGRGRQWVTRGKYGESRLTDVLVTLLKAAAPYQLMDDAGCRLKDVEE